jgi:hypothetical protein
MLNDLRTPLMFVLISIFISIKKKGINKNTYYIVITFSFLGNLLNLLSIENLTAVNITVDGLIDYFTTTAITLIISLIILLIFHLLKKVNANYE